MKRMRIKICGVNDLDFAVEAERLGADYLGFIFAGEGPRRVDVAFVRRVRGVLKGTAECVGVFTDASLMEIAAVSDSCGLRLVQLHRRAGEGEVAALRKLGLGVWTLAGGAEGDAVVFDSSHGDGETVLRPGHYTTVLAGGISVANLENAFRQAPDVIDVSGSLETAPGVKSVVKLRELFRVIKSQKFTKGKL